MKTKAEVFKPDYRVRFNRLTGQRYVELGKNCYDIVKSPPPGLSRPFYRYKRNGKLSGFYPTLRDCVVGLVYGI